MNAYIATFWTHTAAMQTLRSLQAAGIAASAKPVPRELSASCGTCVFFSAEAPCLSLMHRDFERVYLAHEQRTQKFGRGTCYALVAENDSTV